MADKTILDFPELLDTQDTDVIYVVRGVGSTRDRYQTKANLLQDVTPIIQNNTDVIANIIDGTQELDIVTVKGTSILARDSGSVLIRTTTDRGGLLQIETSTDKGLQLYNAAGTVDKRLFGLFATTGDQLRIRRYLDNGTANNDIATFTADGNVLIGTTADKSSKLLAIGGSIQLIIGDSIASSTIKNSRFGAMHYDPNQEPVGLIYATSDTSNNTINVGGGSGSLNAATFIDFYTAANTTTVTGTRVARFTNDRNFLIGTTDNPGPRSVIALGAGTLPSISPATISLIQNNNTTGTSAYQSIISGNAAICRLQLGDTNDEDVCFLQYNHSNNITSFHSNISERYRIGSTGNFLINTTTDNTVDKLQVNGSIAINTLNEYGAGVGVTVDSVLLKDGAIQTDNVLLKTKVVDIGDWNMDAAATKVVAHGLSNFTKIRNVGCIIRSDDDTVYHDLSRMDTSTETIDGGVVSITGSNITLVRVALGGFDNTGFDSTSYNRGWVTITYEI